MTAPHAGATPPPSIYHLMVDGRWTDLDLNTVGQSFRTGSTDVTLNSVAVWLRNNSSLAGTYTITVRADNGGSPGSTLATAVSNATIGAWGDGPFLQSTSVRLSANTQYWVVVDGSMDVGWKYTSTLPATTVSPAPSFESKVDDGLGWSAASANHYNMTLATTSVTPPTTTPPTTTPAPSASCPARRPYRIYNTATSRGIGAHLVARCGYRTEWRRVYRTMGAFAVPNEWAKKKVVPLRWWF